MPIRTFRYYLRHPTADGNESVIYDQLRTAHRYKNTLVEIERGRRAALRAVMTENAATHNADLAKVAEDAKAAVEAIEKEAKVYKSKERKRTIPDELRDRLDAARIVRRDAFKAYGEASKASRTDVDFKAETKRINDVAHELRKNARAHSNLYWGTYLIIEEADEASRKMPFFNKDGPNDPRFERWEGRGAIGVQIQKSNDGLVGMSTEAVFGEDQRLRIQRPDARAWDENVPRGDRKRLQRTKLSMRIGTEEGGRAPIWGHWDMIMHRPLPKGRIKWAEVHLDTFADHRKSGAEWYVVLTVDVDADDVHRHEPGKGGSIGLDLGWRQLDNGDIRVGYWSGDDGEHGEICVPKKLIGDMRYVEELTSIRAENFLKAQAALLTPLKVAEVRAKPEEWARFRRLGVGTFAQWRSAERMHVLHRVWKEHRFDGDAEAFEKLDAFCYRDVHLWRWEANLRRKTRLHRREIYRIAAANLARRYHTLVLEDFNISDVAEKPDVDQQKGDNEVARSNRQLVAPYELRQCFLLAFADRNTNVSGVNTTRDCSACGSTEVFDQVTDLTHVCKACGAEWDRDENASRNLRSAYRKVLAEKQANPETVASAAPNGRWAKRKAKVKEAAA